MDQDILKKLTEFLDKSLTNTKPLIITDTVARTNIDAYCIYAQTECTFTTLDAAIDPNSNTITGLTMAAGEYWYIPIKGTITLATGKLFVYQHKNKNN